jgi:hypothetical protein
MPQLTFAGLAGEAAACDVAAAFARVEARLPAGDVRRDLAALI